MEKDGESGPGRFKKSLGLTDLTFIGLGAIFGSGWLFSASYVAAIAGPAGIVSWLIGGAAAISAGGIIFAYLGLTPIISVAGEVRNPQRTIPIALILSVVLSTIIYLLLQAAFLGSIPAADLRHGWSGMDKLFALPFHDIAAVLGVGWLAFLVVCDAVISPSGTGNIYMNATPRVVYGWSRGGTFFRMFTNVDAKTGIPRPALWLTFALSIFWTLPFPSWAAMIKVVSAALVLSYAVAPVIAAALRRNAPAMPRPFRVHGFVVLGPLSFIVAALIVYWSGWDTVSWLLGLQILLFVLYIPFARKSSTLRAGLAQDVHSSLWLVGFYLLIIAASWLGTFGGRNLIEGPWDSLLVVGIALFVYYWGERTGLPPSKLALHLDEED